MEQNNIWYLAGLVVTAIIAPIATGLVGYWRLKRLGVNRGNIAEIQDRAAFRASLLKRVSDLERQQEEMAARERALIATCARQEREIEDLRADLAAKDDELRKLRKRVKGIEDTKTPDDEQ
jgi:uncharacterized protein HemX